MSQHPIAEEQKKKVSLDRSGKPIPSILREVCQTPKWDPLRKARKRVMFEPDNTLVQIREFEVNPSERYNVSIQSQARYKWEMMKREEANQLAHAWKEGNVENDMDHVMMDARKGRTEVSGDMSEGGEDSMTNASGSGYGMGDAQDRKDTPPPSFLKHSPSRRYQGNGSHFPGSYPLSPKFWPPPVPLALPPALSMNMTMDKEEGTESKLSNPSWDTSGTPPDRTMSEEKKQGVQEGKGRHTSPSFPSSTRVINVDEGNGLLDHIEWDETPLKIIPWMRIVTLDDDDDDDDDEEDD